MDTMRAFQALLVVFALALTGCASIPLATAVSLSAMSPKDLAQLDARQVQVRVSLPLGFVLNVSESRLNLKLSGPGGSRTAEMALVPIASVRSVRSGGVFGSDTEVITYTLRLSPEGAEQLAIVQQFIATRQPTQFQFGINVPFSAVPPQAREVVFWADLKLSDQDRFQPLIDGATIVFSAAEAGS